jgi:hypothetical protein
MIEVPRAALLADKIAAHADFFSFGTNDLTQMTFAFSRDDIGSFLPSYLDKKVLDEDPFKTIDEDGVGQLIKGAVEKGRGVVPNLTIGICGEHGGDPATIDFCYRTGLSYVSCSPFRVPIARLAGAQAVIKHANDSAAAGRKPTKTEATETAKRPGRPARVKAAEVVVSVSADTPDVLAPAKRQGRAAQAQEVESAVSVVSADTPDTPATPKRRGRPAQVAEAEVSVSADTPDAPVTPKRRGRPARAAEAEVSVSADTPEAPATPKRRGRPARVQPAEAEVSVSADTPDAPATPKQRGRPARAQVDEVEVSDSADTPEAPAIPKRRGRPAKTKLEIAATAPDEELTAKSLPKRRGRPARIKIVEDK